MPAPKKAMPNRPGLDKMGTVGNNGNRKGFEGFYGGENAARAYTQGRLQRAKTPTRPGIDKLGATQNPKGPVNLQKGATAEAWNATDAYRGGRAAYYAGTKAKTTARVKTKGTRTSGK